MLWMVVKTIPIIIDIDKDKIILPMLILAKSIPKIVIFVIKPATYKINIKVEETIKTNFLYFSNGLRTKAKANSDPIESEIVMTALKPYLACKGVSLE